MSNSAISSMRSLVKNAIGNFKEGETDKPEHGEFTPPSSMNEESQKNVESINTLPTNSNVDEKNLLTSLSHKETSAIEDDESFQIDAGNKATAGSSQSNEQTNANRPRASLVGAERAGRGKNLNIKKLVVVMVVATILAMMIKSMTGSGTLSVATQDTGQQQSDRDGSPDINVTTVPDAGSDEWTKVEGPKRLSELKTPPLGDQERLPSELLSGVERERQTQQRVINGEILDSVAPAETLSAQKQESTENMVAVDDAKKVAQEPQLTTVIQASLDEIKASTSKTENAIDTIVKRVDAIEKDIAQIKDRNAAAAKARAKAEEKPKVVLKAITRTPNCSTCRPYALVETSAGVRQVSQGDTLIGFTVGVDDDRIVLTNGKHQHSFHLKDGF